MTVKKNFCSLVEMSARFPYLFISLILLWCLPCQGDTPKQEESTTAPKVVVQAGTATASLFMRGPWPYHLVTLDTNSAKIWDLRSCRLWKDFGPQSGGNVLALSRDGKWLATAYDTRIILFETATGRVVWSKKPNGLLYSALDFSPDGSMLAVGGSFTIADDPDYGRFATLWKTNSGEEIGEIEIPFEFYRKPTDIRFAPGGQQLALSDEFEGIGLWNIKSLNKAVWWRPGNEPSSQCRLRWSPSGQTLADATNSKLQLLDARGALRWHHSQKDSFHTSDVWFQDETTLSWVAQGGELWDVATPTGKVTSRQKIAGLTNGPWIPLPDGLLAGQVESPTVVNVGDPAAPPKIDSVDLRSRYTGANCCIWSRNGQKLFSLGEINPASSYQDGDKVTYSPDRTRFAQVVGDEVYIWNLDLGRVEATLPVPSVWTLRWSPDGQILACQTLESVVLWNVTTRTRLGVVAFSTEDISSFAWSPDGKSLAVGDRDGDIYLYRAPFTPGHAGAANVVQIRAGRREQRYGEEGFAWVGALTFNRDGSRLAALLTEGTHTELLVRRIAVWEVGTGKTLFVNSNDVVVNPLFGITGSGGHLAFGLDNRSLITLETEFGGSPEALVQFDIFTKKITREDTALTPMVFSSGYVLETPETLIHSALVSDAKPRHPPMMVTELFAHLSAGHVCDDGSRLIEGHQNGQVALWDARQGRLIATCLGGRAGASIVITPDNYYFATKDILSRINFVLGERAFPFDRFDLQLNRPDVVLRALESRDAELVDYYDQAQKRRQKRLGIVSAELRELPTIKIQTDGLPLATPKLETELSLSASSDKAPLERLRVFVNGSPVSFWMDGGRCDDPKGWRWEKPSRERTGVVRLELGTAEGGRNRIEMAVIDSAGHESSRDSLEMFCTAPPRPVNLRVLTVGVTQYPTQSLRFAAQDALDLRDALAAKSQSFASIQMRTLTDTEVTHEALLSQRSWLQECGVDDVLLIAFSGHGLLDADSTYFFATYDTDFTHPERRGFSYDDWQNLLEGAPARRKLLLMDTCHAGELETTNNINEDVEISDNTSVATTQPGENERAIRLIPGVRKSPDLRLSSALTELFPDLRREGGTVVIAAAGGEGVAIEGGKWGNNGAFTHCVINALREPHLSVSQLLDYTGREVPRLTVGRQRPLARRENLDFDFSLF